MGIITGMDIGGRRRRRVWWAVGWCGGAIVAASAVYAVVHIARGGLGSSDTASLLGLPLGAAALLVSVLALRRYPESNTVDLARGWAADLATHVQESEGRVYNQLIGGDTKPINLAFALQPGHGRTATAPFAGRLLPIPDPPPALLLPSSHPVGVLDVAAYWRQVRPQRLVVTGMAGAGKTVFALALILALLKDRTEGDPVPIRIPVALWDTTGTPFETFVMRRLMAAYGFGRTQAAALVQQGLVLPVLDGLDETDPTLPDGTPAPDAPRARAAMEQLDSHRLHGNPGPVVLTCRTAHLDALAARSALRDAARVTIAPVPPADAAAYLTARATDPARWRPLTDHVIAHPTGALARLLSTPWRLCLTATVYHEGGNPGELTDYSTEQALDGHLLARFIPAATRLHPHPCAYGPEQVHRWLNHLTGALTPTAEATTGTSGPTSARTDLVLHDLWPLAGRTRVRAIDIALTACAVLLAAIVSYVALPSGLGEVALVTVAVAVSAALSKRRELTVSRMRFPEPGGFRPALEAARLAGLTNGLKVAWWAGFSTAIVVLPSGAGLPITLLSALLLGFVTGLPFGLGKGLAVGLETGLGGPPAKEAHPWQLLRDDLLLRLAIGLMVPLVAVTAALLLLLGLTLTGPRPTFEQTAAGLAIFLVPPTTFALVFTLVRAPTRRYLIFLLCSRGRLPLRLVVFLDWACEAGLLRYAGPAYQFRHRELQQWLTVHPEPAEPPAGL